METVYVVLYNQYKHITGEKFDGFFFHLVANDEKAVGLAPHYEEHFRGKTAKEIVDYTVSNDYKPLNFVIEQNKLKTVAEISPKKFIILSEVKSENETVIGYILFNPRNGSINSVSKDKLFSVARSKAELSGMLQNAYLREIGKGNCVIVRKNFLDYPVQIYRKNTETKKKPVQQTQQKQKVEKVYDEFEGFSPEQKRELHHCKDSGVDVDIIFNRKYTPEQMRVLWTSKRDNRFPEEFADPRIDAEVMQYYDSKILTKEDAQKMKPLTIIRPMHYRPPKPSQELEAKRMASVEQVRAEMEQKYQKEMQNLQRIISEISSEADKKGDKQAVKGASAVSQTYQGLKSVISTMPAYDYDDLQTNFQKAIPTIEQALQMGVDLNEILISPEISTIHDRLEQLSRIQLAYANVKMSYMLGINKQNLERQIKGKRNDFQESKIEDKYTSDMSDADKRTLNAYNEQLDAIRKLSAEFEAQIAEQNQKADKAEHEEQEKEKQRLAKRLAKMEEKAGSKA